MSLESNKTAQITGNQAAYTLLSVVLQAGFNDSFWRMFGYKKYPNYGKLITFFRRRSKVQEENFLFKEFLVYSLVQVVLSVKLRAPENWAETILGKLIEELMPQRVWANLDFPSHFAAITYFEKAVTDHVQRCSPEAVSTWAPSLFVQKSRQVVPEGRLLIMVGGAAQICSMDISSFGVRKWLDENLWQPCEVTSPATVENENFLRVASRILAVALP